MFILCRELQVVGVLPSPEYHPTTNDEDGGARICAFGGAAGNLVHGCNSKVKKSVYIYDGPT